MSTLSPEIEVREVAVGTFTSRKSAEHAVDDLIEAGFPPRNIGIAARDRRGEWHEFRSPGESSGAERGAIAGAATGAGVGSLWALGIAAGILPAFGLVVAGGLLVSILATVATGAAAGGLVGALLGLGFTEEEARSFEEEFSDGKVLVTVRAKGRFDEASEILDRHGALNPAAAL